MKKHSGMGKVKVLFVIVILVAVAIASVLVEGRQKSTTYDILSYEWKWFVCNPDMQGYTDLSETGNYYRVDEDHTDEDEETKGALVDHLGVLPYVDMDFQTLAPERIQPSTEPDITDVGENSEFVFVPIDEFGTFEPGLDRTECDKDGDGFIDERRTYVDEEERERFCREKDRYRGLPYDCDDTDSQIRPSTDEKPWPEICYDGIDNDCDDETEDDDTDVCIIRRPDQLDGNVRDRFICLGAEHSGYFFECAGYNLADAINDFTRARRTGSILTTIKEFDCGRTDVNCVARYKMRYWEYWDGEEYQPKDQLVGFLTSNMDIPIRDWTKYKYLDFFVYFASNYYLNIIIAQHDGSDRKGLSNFHPYSYVNEWPITDYIVGKPSLGKWLPVRIPIGDDWTKVDFVGFVARGAEIKKMENSAYAVGPEGNTYAGVIGFDKFHLVQRDLTTDNPDDTEALRYCAASISSKWAYDLSQEDDGEYIAWDACNKNDLPSYGWTGTQCCGDSVYAKDVSPDEMHETYADTAGGCWQANPILPHEEVGYIPFGHIEYEFALTDSESSQSTFCEYDTQCLLPIPMRLDDEWVWEVRNLHPDVYNMYFLEWNENEQLVIASDATPISDDFENKHEKVYLTVPEPPYSLIYSGDNDEFVGCHAPDYIADMLSENDLGTNLDSPEDYCAEIGNFYCSFNNEWAEKDKDTEGNYVDFDDNPVNNQKHGINLVRDGGFERETPLSGWHRVRLEGAAVEVVEGGYQRVAGEENTHSVLIRPRDDRTWRSLEQWVSDIVPGETYLLSGRIKATSLGEDARAFIQVEWLNDNYNSLNEGISTNPEISEENDEFAYVYGVGTAPAGASIAHIRLVIYPGGEGDQVYFDDIRLRSLNLLRNGGFEYVDDNNMPYYWQTANYGSAYSDDKYSGEYSFKTQFDGAHHWQWANQFVSGIVPGKEYSVSNWGKRVNTNGGYARVVVDWYHKDDEGELTLLHKGPQVDNCDDTDISRFATTGIESDNWEVDSGSSYAPKASETCEEKPANTANVRLLGRFSNDEDNNNAKILIDDVQFREANDLEAPFVNTLYSYQGCCPAEWCWDGSECIPDQYDEETESFIVNDDYPIHYDDGLGTVLACHNGGWNTFYMMQDYADSDAYGHCNDKSQCYHMDTDGNGRCYADGEFGEDYDYICDNGKWTSRTKYAAMTLYEAATGALDFSEGTLLEGAEAATESADLTLLCSPNNDPADEDPLFEILDDNDNNIVPLSSVCILQREIDGESVFAVAAPLDLEGNEDQKDAQFEGFVESVLGIDDMYFNHESCTSEEDNDFDACDLSGLDEEEENEPIYTGPVKSLHWHDDLKIFIMSNNAEFEVPENPITLPETVFEGILNYDVDSMPGGEGDEYDTFKEKLKELIPQSKYYRYLFLKEKTVLEGDEEVQLYSKTYKALLESPQPAHPQDIMGWSYDKENTFAGIVYKDTDASCDDIEGNNLAFLFDFGYGNAYCDDESEDNAAYAFATQNADSPLSLTLLWHDASKRFRSYGKCAYKEGYHEAFVPAEVRLAYAAKEYLLYDNPTVSSCCPIETCWAGEGEITINEQEFEYSDNGCVGISDTLYWHDTDTGRAFQCIDVNWHREDEEDYVPIAEWNDVYFKVHWDTNPEHSGPCDQAQCWKQKPGEDARCVNAGYYDEDHYCLMGADGNAKWSTRTAFVAAKLRDIVETVRTDDYTIFCDEDRNTLNIYRLNDPSNHFNKFCTLRFKEGSDDKVVVGTSFNSNAEDMDSLLSDIEIAMAQLLGTEEPVECPDWRTILMEHREIGPFEIWYGTWPECTVDDWHIYFKPGETLIIFSKEAVPVNGWTFLEILGRFIINPFRFLRDYEHLNIPEDMIFDRLYMTERESLSILGAVQNLYGSKFVSVKYTVDESEPCTAVNLYDNTHHPLDENKISCEGQRPTYNVYTAEAEEDERDEYFDFSLDIWTSLSSKLRLSKKFVCGRFGYPDCPNGHSCESDGECISRFCDDGVCTRLRYVDESCESDNRCITRNCYRGRCVIFRPEGAPCDSDRQCFPMHECERGECSPKDFWP